MTTIDSSDAPMSPGEITAMRRENLHLREIASQTMSRILQIDTQMIAIRHELEQKRRGFRLMSELAFTMMNRETDHENDFIVVCRHINVILNMQRTVLLVPDKDENNLFRVLISQGYSPEEQNRLARVEIRIVDKTLLDPINPVLITKATPDTYLASFRKILGLPFLISSPVLLYNELVGILITGRLDERMPFLPRLGRNDVETVQTVASYMAAIQLGHLFLEAENLANYDPLTRLPNLRRIKEGLHQVLVMSRRNGTLGAVLFIDLDGFKSINDTYGHAAGDAVLHSVAKILAGSVRESDIIGRIGGDEFLAVLSGLFSSDHAVSVAAKIIHKLSQPIEIYNALQCTIGASIGVCVFPDGDKDEIALIKTADEAMYAAKKNGKNTCVVSGRTGV
ncbi:MAG: sensor domain-containing diguanylate cyclase [Candidatus Accumulibacter sp.]|jgi:diguanylate cyclase (GGDEF)-like protein|nr:sensor domain-containing diguanylate cyclase [Accumulibacter sp.]